MFPFIAEAAIVGALGTVTVTTAFELTRPPAELDTVTEYVPASLRRALVKTRLLLVAALETLVLERHH